MILPTAATAAAAAELVLLDHGVVVLGLGACLIMWFIHEHLNQVDLVARV